MFYIIVIIFLWDDFFSFILIQILNFFYLSFIVIYLFHFSFALCSSTSYHFPLRYIFPLVKCFLNPCRCKKLKHLHFSCDLFHFHSCVVHYFFYKIYRFATYLSDGLLTDLLADFMRFHEEGRFK